MESGSVRKNIALKLRDQGPPPASNKEGGEIVEDGGEGVEGNQDYSVFKWDHPVNLCGRPVKDPLLHLCEICSLPVLIYGRMKRCRHAFCRDCAKKAAGVCPKCNEEDQTFEEASMGTVHICTHGGGRYDNSGCGRSYLSLRDLEAHRLYRHTKDKGLGQAAHLTAPPPQAHMAGFLPQFFQMPPRLPPGFPGNLPPPPTALGSVLRPLPPNPLGAPLLPPPQFVGAPRPIPSVGISSSGTQPQSVGPIWTHPPPPAFK